MVQRGSIQQRMMPLLRERRLERIFLPYLRPQDCMRLRVLLPAVLLVCSCTKTGEQTPAAKADSAVIGDPTSTPGAVTAAKKETKGESAAAASPKSATSSKSSAPAAQGSAGTAKTVASTPQDTRCGVKGNPVLTDLGIGNLSIGRTVDAVKASCRIIRDIPEMTVEGSVERVLTVAIAGDYYRASVVSGLIGRVWVRTSRIATSDGLRVGTPLRRVAALKGVKIAESEEGLYLLPGSHCGLSFRFSVQSRWPTGRSWTMEELVRRHGNQPVSRILVTRCLRTA